MSDQQQRAIENVFEVEDWHGEEVESHLIIAEALRICGIEVYT